MPKNNNKEQMSLFDKAEMEKKPPTRIMKEVALKAANKVNAGVNKKEIDELLKREKDEQKKIGGSDETKKLREEYRRIKRRVKEMEAGNNSRVIAFPVLTNGGEWYKVVEFSALYYVYRLADRMGRQAKIYKDKDNFLKCIYAASFRNIDKFAIDFKRLEQGKVEKAVDGVYIFTLKEPLTDEEVGMLRRTEETRRDLMHNMLKPKEMEPEAYQAILMVVRQVMPKVNKLEMSNYKMLGEKMMIDIRQILAVYFDVANGLVSKKEAGLEILRLINQVSAAFSILGETRVWDYAMVAAVAENLNNLKRITEKKIK